MAKIYNTLPLVSDSLPRTPIFNIRSAPSSVNGHAESATNRNYSTFGGFTIFGFEYPKDSIVRFNNPLDTMRIKSKATYKK